jgi:hypothetical protein
LVLFFFCGFLLFVLWVGGVGYGVVQAEFH